ncbi:MAG: hypothetical protein EPO09_15020 [Aquabacterium sp.]|uniref:hypothetical protein n=1 Tax=Aquabacterium sp. TaxID=1872578 RepID=UPI00121B95BC|nr:hypothetical protein [Aquabacterium sp.]TAK92679.1 MAG: hypothetical protein EPO09_15020 [Aquabacterium sp.]
MKKAHGVDMRLLQFEIEKASGDRIHVIAHRCCRLGNMGLWASSRSGFGGFVTVMVAISIDLGWLNCLRRRCAGARHIRNAGNHDVDPLGEGIQVFGSSAAC